uniref:Uncharacterized protein n=1 Tax=Panagrolaimus sp. PS1159 TaxID=55785 RepID=A0AC35GC99_9BILA
MSKAIFFACFLVIIVLSICIEAKETNMENSEVLNTFRGSRVKRGWFCWDGMVGSCCKNKCKGDGCVGFMCDACC